MEIDRYNQLKRKLDKAKTDKAKAEGACDELIKKLKEVWGCSTVEEAEKQLKDLRKKEEKAKEDFEKSLAKFEEKWENDERVS